MLKFIQFVQKRPSDKTIRLTWILFWLIIILGGYYNLIHQWDALQEVIFWYTITSELSNYVKYGIIALWIFPLIKSITNKCFLQKKYIKYFQLFYAIILFYIASIIEETAQLDFDTLIWFIALLPLFSWITWKFITSNCLKYWEKITKIRV